MAALQYIRDNVIVEHVFKYPDRAKADRIFNVPYIAIEEALVNAMYHRSYDIREPVEVRILPEEIFIKSFPGPDISINLDDLQKGKGAAKQYTNRRIGDFLKELDLTEGRGTGIPKILRAMKANGSPVPSFESNEERSYFLTVLPVHPKVIDMNNIRVKRAQSEAQSEAQSKELLVLNFLLEKEASKSELAFILGDPKASGSTKRFLKRLLDAGLIQYTIPDHPQSRLQKYKISKNGKSYLLNNT